jgi:2-dehydro-3-deoxyglucarate aldolase/4-hydroxy-2-oxoheptanedioate aldolase
MRTETNLKAKLANGGHAFGTMVFEFFTPGMPAIVASANADFILFDMEHAGSGFETLKSLMAGCRGLGLAPLIRVPHDDYHFIARALDIGAHGVMVPMVETVEQARHIVSCAHYPPHGRRGAAFSVAHDDYLPGPPGQKMAAARARTIVIPQIETATGLANVEAIAAVEGVDVVWLGHFDLTNSMGIPGQFDHPDYRTAVARDRRGSSGRGQVCRVHGRRRDMGAGLLGARLPDDRLRPRSSRVPECLEGRHRPFEGTSEMSSAPRVGLTRDLLDSTGNASFGADALRLFDQESRVAWEFIPEMVSEITPAMAARYDAIYVNSPKVTAATVAGPTSACASSRATAWATTRSTSAR